MKAKIEGAKASYEMTLKYEGEDEETKININMNMTVEISVKTMILHGRSQRSTAKKERIRLLLSTFRS